MSYLRIRSRAVNQAVYLGNRVENFLHPPMTNGDLYVEKNETVGEDLNVRGNLTIGGDLRARSYYATGNYYLNNYVLIPAGTIVQSAAVNEPMGWFSCDGRILLKTVYADLFNAISYTYSGGVYSGFDVSFNLPDLRGRVAIGNGTGSGLTTRNIGSTGGAETHTLTPSEIPSHTHSSNATGGSIGLITANGYNTAIVVDSSPIEPNIYAAPQALTINPTGGDGAHNNMQPYIVLRYLIKY